MKRLLNYTIEEFEVFILPHKHSSFREICLEDSNTMKLAYTQFLLDQVETEMGKLRKKRKELNKMKREKLKEIFDSKPMKIKERVQ